MQLADLETLKPILLENDVQAAAVCFLHSFTNPDHEQQAGAWLREFMPELSISLSAQVAPEIREYERMSTTVCNAYVQPHHRALPQRIADSTWPRAASKDSST